MTKVAIIGTGPCGLSMLRAFEHAEKKVKKYQKLYVLRNKKTGVDFGIIVGEQVQINTVTLFTIVCTDICGQMDQKNVWNLLITLLMNTLENLYHHFLLEKFYMTI